MKKFGYPEVVVGTFILNRRGELLLTKSKKWPGLYSVPGGHVEMGESIEDTAKRETEEEVGLRIKFVRVICSQEVIYPKEFHRRAQFIFIDALCRAKSTRVKLDNKELYDYIWIKPKASLKLKLNTDPRRAIMQMVGKGKKKNWLYAKTK